MLKKVYSQFICANQLIEVIYLSLLALRGLKEGNLLIIVNDNANQTCWFNDTQ